MIPKKHLYFITEFELNISWFPFFHFKKTVCDFKHVEICLDHERGMIVKECKKVLRGRRTHALTSYLFFSFRLTSGGTIYNQPQRKKYFFRRFFGAGHASISFLFWCAFQTLSWANAWQILFEKVVISNQRGLINMRVLLFLTVEYRLRR